MNCGAVCVRLKALYCCHKCHRDHEYKKYIARWKEGKEKGHRRCVALAPSSYVRRYMFEKYGRQCGKCGWSEVNPSSGRIPLQINHIDGDAENCSEDNLELLCPNCHSLTPNFGSLNRGNSKRIYRHRTGEK